MFNKKKEKRPSMLDTIAAFETVITKIPKYKIHNIELLKTKEYPQTAAANLFILWMQKLVPELISDWNVSIYLGYSEDDLEKREPYYYPGTMNKDVSAISDYYKDDRVVNFTFNLSRDYSEITDINDLIFEIGQTAFHEVLHVVLSDFDTNKNLDKIHKTIVNLENHVFPYIYNSVLESLNSGFNI